MDTSKINKNEDAESLAAEGKRSYWGGETHAPDYSKALEYFERAAELGSAEAPNFLGIMYEHGKGVAKDLKKAFFWYKLSAELKSPYGLCNAGICYEYGIGVEKDLDKAFELYKKSAEAGNPVGRRYLATCYHEGKGVLKNIKEAISNYKLAADLKDNFSMNSLGVIYHNGDGVDVDYVEAARFYRLGIDAGNPYSLNNLGLLYQYGRGVDKSELEAKKLFKLAIEQGLEIAKKNLELLEKESQKNMDSQNTTSKTKRTITESVKQSVLAALEQLRLKLLDLSGNNRLINFRHTAGKSLQFVDGDVVEIYTKLTEQSASVHLDSLPEPKKTEWQEVNGRLQRMDPKEWAKLKGVSLSYDLDSSIGSKKQQLQTLMYADDLAKHCRKIEREAILAIEETGANMLYLVLGFLEFPDSQNSDKTFLSPLVNIPVEMSKKEIQGIQHFSISYTGDDIAENLSLREKLKRDFGITMPEIDEEEFELESYLDEIEEIVQNHPRFSVKRRASLCLLSFSNMILVDGLKPESWPGNELLEHEIVSEVLEGGEGEAEGGQTYEEYDVEEGVGAAIPLIYDADSSQHSALIDVVDKKRNLVVVGPPGTGKSQTITNLIASSIAEGKKVLFVAEKMAALEVVKNRLELAGLAPFVLELHSNKTNKKRVIEDIAKRISFEPSPSRDMPRMLAQLEDHRKRLKAYADLINSVSYNSFSLTLNQIIWRADKHRLSLSTDEQKLSQFEVLDASEISEFELERRVGCLNHLANHFALIDGFDHNSAFWGFFPGNLLPGDEQQIRQILENYKTLASDLLSNTESLLWYTGEEFGGVDSDKLQKYRNAIKKLSDELDADYIGLIKVFGDYDDAVGPAGKVLEFIESVITEFNDLDGKTTQALRLGISIDSETLQNLKNLKHLSDSLGFHIAQIASLNEAQRVFKQYTETLSESISVIKSQSEKKKFDYKNNRENLDELKALCVQIKNAPEEYFYLKTPNLFSLGSVEAIAELIQQQQDWISLNDELSQNLYLDSLPAEQIIKDAINILRQGDKWYRIFQREWRFALTVHKNLQLKKEKVPSEQRVEELSKIIRLNSAKTKWQKNNTWSKYLGLQEPDEPLELSGYFELAKWNEVTQELIENFSISDLVASDLTPQDLKSLKRDFSPLETHIDLVQNVINEIDQKFTKITQFSKISELDVMFDKADTFEKALSQNLEFLNKYALEDKTLPEVIVSAESIVRRAEIKHELDSYKDGKDLLGDYFTGLSTNIVKLNQVYRTYESIEALDLYPAIKRQLKTTSELSNDLTELDAVLSGLAKNLLEIEEFSLNLKKYGDFDLSKWVEYSIEKELDSFSTSFDEKLKRAITNLSILLPWSQYISRNKEAREIGLGSFIDFVELHDYPRNEMGNTYAYVTFATIMRNAFKNLPQLASFTGLQQNHIRDEFKRLDSEIIRLRGKSVAALAKQKAVVHPGVNGAKVNDKTEMALLKYLMPQQRPRMALRKVLLRAGNSIQALKPCFMMGPQAVAQYLAPGTMKFDLVIMDEASQLKPEEAIGAIARGGQLVVVGDPNQLPPTSFFSRMDDAGNQYASADSESILDLCKANFRATRLLKWHYRSHHHSLIAFSNRHFYRDELVVFPSPYGQSSKLGVKAVYLKDAVYENQTNFKEAKRVVDAVVEHIKARPKDSLGIVTLNIKQRDLIAEMIDDRLADLREADEYRDKWIAKGEPLFVKNLENVQGDERDAIIISTTFGKGEGTNVVRQNFGPISRQGGWRRLNVLFTRAKKSVTVYTSLRPEDIVDDTTTPEGTKALRNYLEYARSGSLAVSEVTGLEPDSDFEVSVIDTLRANNYEVTPQLGVAKFRIDIAVKHPDVPGTYLAAIECDGATYHSALSVRDRDRIRQEILESLGWKGRIWRIWSTDWFRSPRSETQKLLSFLEHLRQNWKPEYSAADSWIEEGEANQIFGDLNQDVEEILSTTFEEDKAVIDSTLLDDDDYLEVEVGDTVKYANVNNLNDILTVQIISSDTKDDIANGVISEARPLAQILLGAVIGDEVKLHLPGAESKFFKIIEIIKDH